MITVDKALMRGQFMINVPVIVIIFSVMGLLSYLAIVELIPFYFVALSVLIGPVVAWIYWSFAITYWRIWAFSNVDDVHELRNLAVSGKLIWPDGSFFERTEIRTKKQKILIKELEKRFNEPKNRQQYVDDLSVPQVTKIFFSKSALVYKLIVAAALLSVGIYLLVVMSNWIFGIALILIGLNFAIKDFKKLSTDAPQLVLDSNGIDVAGVFYPWTEIQDFSVKWETSSQSSKSYLILETSSGTLEIDIDNYDTQRSQLKHLLNTYKGRFEKATARNSSWR